MSDVDLIYFSNGNKNMFLETIYGKKGLSKKSQKQNVSNYKVVLRPCQKLEIDLELFLDFKRKNYTSFIFLDYYRSS